MQTRSTVTLLFYSKAPSSLLMGLAGMTSKNIIVLLDEINTNLESGKSPMIWPLTR